MHPKQTIIVQQGSSNREIYFLHSGTIEIKRCGENIAGYEATEILKKSKRIGVIEAPSIFGVQNLLSNKPHENSFLAQSDCLITRYVVSPEKILNFFRANPPISLNILLTMCDQARKNITRLKQVITFLGMVETIKDNLSLIHVFFLDNRENNELYNRFTGHGGNYPATIDTGFLTENYSTALGKAYGVPNYNPEEKFKWRELDFYLRLLKAKPQSFVSLMNADIKIFIHLFETLSTVYNAVNSETEKYISRIDAKMNDLFLDQQSPFYKLVGQAVIIKNHPNASTDLTRSIVNIMRNLEQKNKQLGGRDYPEVYKLYEKLQDGQTVKVEKSDNKDKKKQVKDGKYKKMYKDSVKKILEYSKIPGERRRQIQKNLQEMSKLDRNDLLNKKSRQVIQKLQNDFFDLYQACFLEEMKHPGSAIPAVKLLFYFGFIDEKLCNEEEIEFIHEAQNFFTQSGDLEYPVISLFDYLFLIYNGDEQPSMTETGEIFSKLVKKVFSKKERKWEDTPECRLEFEVQNMVKSAMRITSENLRAYIPWLSSSSFKGTFTSLFSSPQKIESYIKKVNAIDYSMFFRETTWKIPGKSELIRKEVKPYFIIVPNSGIRIQMWQEMVNNLRVSRGRFCVPSLFIGDLNKSLVQSLAHYRWELNKSIVSNWMDPVDGGLTGAYYDYTQYYHKSIDLPSETKDEIKRQFNSIKIDRDRFAHDYYYWVEFEKDGIPKLNKLVRPIFYRYIPFPKEIRENLAKLPVYLDMDRKFTNIRNRDIKKMEVRLKKYQDGMGMLPEDLQAFLDLLRK
jgi:hypothetical protein